eukprot:Pgem_evm1s2138
MDMKIVNYSDVNCYRLALGFTYMYSGYSTWYLLKYKSDSQDTIIYYIDTVVTPLKSADVYPVLHGDNDAVFIDKKLQAALVSRNIRASFTTTYTPQRNAQERQNLIFSNMVRTTLIFAGLPR